MRRGRATYAETAEGDHSRGYSRRHRRWFSKQAPDVTKPPGGGLSPLEHLRYPDGQGVSRIRILVNNYLGCNLIASGEIG